jgi:hypothetical protein
LTDQGYSADVTPMLRRCCAGFMLVLCWRCGIFFLAFSLFSFFYDGYLKLFAGKERF